MTRVVERLAAAAMLACSLATTGAATLSSAHAAGRGPVVVGGHVPDDAARQAVLARLRAVFGDDGVEDRLTVGGIAAPPGWSDSVGRLLTPALRQLHEGRLEIRDRAVTVSGRVDDAAARDALRAALARDGYALRDRLHLAPAPAPAPEQATVDAAVAGRSVEFERGAATLTPAGERLLAELLPPLRRLPDRRIEVVGHTDSAGTREANLALSRARADTVRDWLAARGVAPARIASRGAGPDEPVADNASAAGRARNRRIEFRVLDAREEAAWTSPR